MAAGKEIIKMIIGTDLGDNFVILQAPSEIQEVLDGSYCEDNGFVKSTLPPPKGIYEVDCEVYWDDGRSYYGEPSDPDWKIEILNYRKLLPLD